MAPYAENNTLFHNNFNNTQQVYMYDIAFLFKNTWDNGYPSGGNYWGDFAGLDLYSGPYQNVTGSDRIVDTPYVINENNVDHYPFQGLNGWLLPPPIPGDIDDDGIVNIQDVLIAAMAFGSQPGDPNWNPIADLNSDGIVNILDLVIVGVNFGKTY